MKIYSDVLRFSFWKYLNSLRSLGDINSSSPLTLKEKEYQKNIIKMPHT